MAKLHHYLLTMFFILLTSISVPTTSLRSSQSWSLLMLRHLLRNPPALHHWSNRTDFCSLDPSLSLTIVCYGESITQLHISGEPGSPPLPPRFSVDSFFTTLTRLPGLKVLSLTSLGLRGPLPAKISRLSRLEILDLSSNYLSGAIPRDLSGLKDLQSLILDHNAISGGVPPWLPELPQLAVLSLRNNSLVGSLPDTIRSVQSLRVIRLAANNLSGEVPDLRRLVNLQVLDLEGNAFASRFPPLCRKVVAILLSGNRLTGGVPHDIGSYYMLQQLDVSSNRFVGPFPAAAVLALPLLRRLNISGNKFTGMLFKNTSCGDSLESVDLSANLLTGSLPECLITRNVSYQMNCLDTAAGEAQHRPAFCQNEALAVGFLLRRRGKSHKGKAALASSVIGGGAVGIMFIGVVLVLIARRAGRKNLKQKPARRLVEHASNGHPLKMLSDARYASQIMKLGALGIAPYRVFSLEELEAATNNFESASFMGEGSYGQMYRGRIKDGSVVAIRCLKLKKKYTTQSLTSHLELIAKLRHCHLASALGHCLEYYLEDSTVSRVFLVFEYIPNGSLRSHICGNFVISEDLLTTIISFYSFHIVLSMSHWGIFCLKERASGQKLTWMQRISAAIGVAKGIQFLHIGVVPGLFGNNLKTTNVMLDKNLVAKISSCNLPVLANDISTELAASSCSSGTKGVNKSTKPDEKTDVYDFGIMLLEMITGRPVVPETLDMVADQLHSILVVDRVARKKVLDAAVTLACSEESLRTVTEICICCLSKDPSSRPSIDDVLWNLQFAIQVQDSSSRGDSQGSDSSNSPYRRGPPVISIK